MDDLRITYSVLLQCQLCRCNVLETRKERMNVVKTAKVVHFLLSALLPMQISMIADKSRDHLVKRRQAHLQERARLVILHHPVCTAIW